MLARFGCGNTNNGGLQAKEEELTAGLKILDDFLVRLGFGQVRLELSVSRLKMKWHGLEVNGKPRPLGSPIYRLLG